MMMNKKQLVFACIFLVNIISIYGCTTMQKFNKDCQKDIENTKFVYERVFENSYKEVFLASLSVIHDWGAEIFLKDYEDGKIFVRTHMNWSVPGDIFGLYFYKVTDKETRIILKVSRRSYGLKSATSGDVFNAIAREIQFRKKIIE